MKKLLKLNKDELFFIVLENIIISTLVILPLIFLPFKGIKDIYSGPRYVFLLVVTTLALILLAFNTKHVINRISLSKANILIVIFFIFLSYSLSYSINIYFSLYGFGIWRDGYIVQSIFIMLFFISQIPKKIHINFFKYITISATIVASYGIVQSIGFDFVKGFNPNGFLVFSTMYNQNFFGTYLVLILPIIIHQILHNNNKLYILSYAFLFYALLETNTRGAWLGFIISFIFYFTVYIKKIGLNSMIKRKILIIIILSTFLLIIFDLRNGGIFTSRFTSIFKEANQLLSNTDIDQIGSNRGYIWAKSIEYIMSKPLFGYGIQNIILYFLFDHGEEMKTIFGNVLLVNNVHNEYLQIAISTGIPSLVIYMSFIYQVLKSGFIKINDNLAYLALISSVIAYLVQAFFSLSFITVAYIFWIFMGILINKSNIFN